MNLVIESAPEERVSVAARKAYDLAWKNDIPVRIFKDGYSVLVNQNDSTDAIIQKLYDAAVARIETGWAYEEIIAASRN